MPAMGNMYVMLGLRDKRARIAGEIEKAERILARQRDDLARLDAVIRLFEPESNPELIPPIRPVSRRSFFFRHGEQQRLCLDALREQAAPMRCRTVAERVMLAKGLPTDKEAIVQSVALQVRVALFRLEAKGLVRRIVKAPETWWELVGGTGA